MNGEKAGNGAGGGGRARANVKFLPGRAEIGLNGPEIDLGHAPPAHGRLAEEIIYDAFARDSAHRATPAIPAISRRLGAKKAAAAERSQNALADAGRQHGRKSGVEGVAALFEHLRSGPGRYFMARRHHAFHERIASPQGLTARENARPSMIDMRAVILNCFHEFMT
jgi:hypothetical protein